MNVGFDRLFRILESATTEKLSENVVEVCRLTPQSYSTIQEMLVELDKALEREKL